MSNPTRFRNGLSTQAPDDLMANYPVPDQVRTGKLPNVRVCSYSNDFNTLIGTDFTVSGVGTPTFALGTARGGVAVLSTANVASDSAIALKNGTSFGFVSGSRSWYVTSVAVSDVVNSTVDVGMADAAALTDGITFHMAPGGVVSLVAHAAGVSTTLVPTVTTLVSNTQTELGLYYNGTDLLVYVNNGLVARVSNLTMSTALITPVFSIITSNAVAQTLTIDYVTVAEEETRLNTSSYQRI